MFSLRCCLASAGVCAARFEHDWCAVRGRLRRPDSRTSRGSRRRPALEPFRFPWPIHIHHSSLVLSGPSVFEFFFCFSGRLSSDVFRRRSSWSRLEAVSWILRLKFWILAWLALRDESLHVFHESLQNVWRVEIADQKKPIQFCSRSWESSSQFGC